MIIINFAEASRGGTGEADDVQPARARHLRPGPRRHGQDQDARYGRYWLRGGARVVSISRSGIGYITKDRRGQNDAVIERHSVTVNRRSIADSLE